MHVLVAAAIASVFLVAFIIAAYRRKWAWTGFITPPDADTTQNTPHRDKTLWDWLQLLVIPLALAAVAFALNAWQSNREHQREDRRERAASSSAIDAQREQVLRAYLQDLSGLMLHEDLADSPTYSPVQKVARAITLTALRRLDAKRKSFVVRFLSEAHLIDVGAQDGKINVRDAQHGKINLRDADLRSVQLHDLDLDRADFRGTRLDGADFTNSSIVEAQFSGACVNHARFVKANLSEAQFDAEGDHVDFSGAQLGHAEFQGAQLTDVNLRGAKTLGIVWPRGWTATGSRLSDAQARALCARSSP